MGKGAGGTSTSRCSPRPRARLYAHGPRGETVVPEPLQDAIAAEYAAGAHLRPLALRYHLSERAIRQIVRSRGGQIRPPGRGERQVSPALAAEFVREYEVEHLNTAEIAARHGLSDDPVRRALKAAGIELRKYALNAQAPLSTAERASIAVNYADGSTLVELARRFRCSTSRIREAIVEHGVLIRTDQRKEPFARRRAAAQ